MTRQELHQQLHEEFMSNGRVERIELGKMIGWAEAFRTHCDLKNQSGDNVYVSLLANWMTFGEISKEMLRVTDEVIDKYWGDLFMLQTIDGGAI